MSVSFAGDDDFQSNWDFDKSNNALLLNAYTTCSLLPVSSALSL